jgi:predicted negative regulator of RcsB-dependent stress response
MLFLPYPLRNLIFLIANTLIMRKIIFGIILTLIILFTFKYCNEQKQAQITLTESSALIEKQIKNVSKLVVTEGQFSEVFNYQNSKAIFGDYLTADKKALVVVNAKVTVSYDLKAITYNIDQETKTLEILSIPEQEINISPDLEYYDIQADFLNPFEAKDYNDIKETVKTSLMKKMETSTLKTNAENRLLSELSKFFILTESLGWTLVYKSSKVTTKDEFETLVL